jgi:hypothetical protein
MIFRTLFVYEARFGIKFPGVFVCAPLCIKTDVVRQLRRSLQSKKKNDATKRD